MSDGVLAHQRVALAAADEALFDTAAPAKPMTTTSSKGTRVARSVSEDDPDNPQAWGAAAGAVSAGAPGSGRPRLDRRRVLDAAVEFIDEHGLSALTMRRLGAHLGVEAMALYRYVAGRESLIDGVVETVLDELYADPEVHITPVHGWQDYLHRLAHGVRRIALAHPAVFPTVATRPPGRR